MKNIATEPCAARPAPVPAGGAVRRAMLFLAGGWAVIGLAWLAAPQVLLGMWDVATPDAARLVGRRAGVLFLGFGAAFWLARGAVASVAGAALLRGTAVACLGLCALGALEWRTGTAGPGILAAAGVELAFAAGLIVLARRAGR